MRSRHERGYGARWEKIRLHALRRDFFLCQACEQQGRTTPATEVDHIKRKADGGTDDLDNLQSLCHDCHKAKTRRENSADVLEFTPDGWPVWPDEY